MNYQDTLDYLYSQLPMFHRIGPAAYKADLSNTIQICEVLGNPEKRLNVIHIAGTNGKGSVSHMLASILQQAGYRTGLYTSPHLIDFRERIKINGEMIPEEYVISFVEKYREPFDIIKPSFFEWTVGLCFDYFTNSNVDIAVIETGLGGRLDSTNVLTPLISVITNISFDHQALLGDTLEKIAAEKAGIIKKEIPVVIGETHPVTKDVFINKAREMNSPIFFADQVFSATDRGMNDKGRRWNIHSSNTNLEITCQLRGIYQGSNVRTVLTALKVLSDTIKIPESSLTKGLSAVIDNTGLYGRWQILNSSPRVICDTGHNEAGIMEILKGLELETYGQLHWVLGMVNDKDINKVLSLLPSTAKYYFTKASIPRALNEQSLSRQAHELGLHGNTYPDVHSALTAALSSATDEDLIMIGGSTFIVGDVLALLKSNGIKDLTSSRT